MTRRSLVVLVIAACSSDATDHGSSGQRRDSTPRVIEPPSGTLRPLPPYAIIATEVGPYKLRQKIGALLETLPSGPRIARLEIPGLLHSSVIHTEDDTVLIGGEPDKLASNTTFVAVIGGEVARTEAGVHVGQSKKQLDKIAPQATDPDRARDPRLIVPAALRNGRILLADDRVVAIAIVNEPGAPSRDLSADASCPRPASNDAGVGACLTGAGERLEISGDDVVVRSIESGNSIATVRVPGLVFAAPLRNATDGRDDIVVVSRTDEPQQRTWWLTAYAIEGTKRTTVIDQTQLYQLQSAQSRWIGADLHDVELYLEVTGRADAIDVGGLLTTREQHNKIRDVVVISPMTIPRRHGRDAGVSEPSRSGADSAKP